MNRKQESERSMYLVVEQYVKNTDQTLLDQMPNFEDAFQDFERALDKLKDASEEQLYNRTGNAEEKQIYREDMAVKTQNIASRMRAFAFDNGNMVLFRKIGLSLAAIKRLKDTICKDYCQMVNDDANAILADLAPYGVLQLDLTEQQEAINKFNLWQTKPRTAIVDRRINTFNIGIYLSDCAKTAADMDVHIKMLETIYPTFVTQYFYSRKAIAPSYRTIPLLGTITNPAGEKLSGAIIKINSLGFSKLSTATGRFQFKSIPAGVYNVIVELEGYETTTHQVAIVANQRTEVNITLTEGTTLRVAS